MKAVWTIFVILLIGAAGYGGFWYGRRAAPATASTEPSSDAGAAPDTSDDVTPTASVKVAPIEKKAITKNVVAYGTVVAEPSEINSYSVPYESHVNRVLVSPGQSISANTPMVEVSPSADAQLQYRQAQSAVEAAQKDLSQTQQRLDDHLATEQELLISRQNLEQAQLKTDAMEKNGVAGIHQVLSQSAGIVSKLDVQVGAVVPADGPIIETVPENKIEVRLGLEPEDANVLADNLKNNKLGEVKITLIHSDNSTPLAGAVQLVSHRINPDTRLVDVFVTLPEDASVPLDTFVSGQMGIAVDEGLVVPHNAVLPDDEGNVLFTVKDGKAVKHAVTVGLRNDKEVEISGDGLSPGDLVVVAGNLELDDAMAVNVIPSAPDAATQADATQPDAAQPAGTQPATQSDSTQPAGTQPATQPDATRPAGTQPATQTDGTQPAGTQPAATQAGTASGAEASGAATMSAPPDAGAASKPPGKTTEAAP